MTALQTSVTAHHGFEELPGPGVEAAADPDPCDVLAEAGGAHGDEAGEAGVARGQGHHVPHYVVIRRVPAIMDHGHIAGEDYQTDVSVPLQGTGGVAPCPGAWLPGDLDRNIYIIYRSIYLLSPAHLIRQGDGAPPEEVLAAPRGAGRLGGAGEGEAALVQVGQLARGPARRAVWVHRGL